MNKLRVYEAVIAGLVAGGVILGGLYLHQRYSSRRAAERFLDDLQKEKHQIKQWTQDLEQQIDELRQPEPPTKK